MILCHVKVRKGPQKLQPSLHCQRVRLLERFDVAVAVNEEATHWRVARLNRSRSGSVGHERKFTKTSPTWQVARNYAANANGDRASYDDVHPVGRVVSMEHVLVRREKPKACVCTQADSCKPRRLLEETQFPQAFPQRPSLEKPPVNLQLEHFRTKLGGNLGIKSRPRDKPTKYSLDRERVLVQTLHVKQRGLRRPSDTVCPPASLARGPRRPDDVRGVASRVPVLLRRSVELHLSALDVRFKLCAVGVHVRI
mmetsp:Transcript_2604/g.6171  ORF Transcript_2604/g.6171 Transcript_2604/m.6171 type:complete len:253 (-) Transcript_2604:1173-1931(-)